MEIPQYSRLILNYVFETSFDFDPDKLASRRGEKINEIILPFRLSYYHSRYIFLLFYISFLFLKNKIKSNRKTF